MEGIENIKVIKNGSSVLQRLIAPNKEKCHELKWSDFVFFVDIKEGSLIWNELTGALFLIENISPNELKGQQIDQFVENIFYKHSFLVPKDIDEYKRWKSLEGLLKVVDKKVENNSYTILTTLACNARCYYCFEKEFPRHSMSEKTAYDVVNFIKDTLKGEEAKLIWFGGEPLVNIKAVDIISFTLSNLGLPFMSTMTTNGYFVNFAASCTTNVTPCL